MWLSKILCVFIFGIIVVNSTGLESQKNSDFIIVPPDDNSPKFVSPVHNTTVTIGHNALLSCVVDNLQNYKVAWIKASAQAVLTTHQSVVTNDSRITLSYNDHRSWYLHVRDVTERDRGWYICQINTNPVTSQFVFLQVLVPPMIIEDESSSDVVARELTDVTLQCKATGYPDPYVMWRRGDGNDFNYNGEKVNVVDGEKLNFRRISRLHMGTYYCIAQNGISPPFYKKITLTVHFPPILYVPNQLIGISVHQKATLLCISEAYPKSINYWTKEKDMIIQGELGKHYEVSFKYEMYTTHMMLTINNVTSSDYGSYYCVSVNPIGNTDGVIKLYEVTTPLEYELKFPAFNNTEEDHLTQNASIAAASAKKVAWATHNSLHLVLLSFVLIY